MTYPPMFDLSGRTAIVTGAGGGLDAACAAAMAEAASDFVTGAMLVADGGCLAK